MKHAFMSKDQQMCCELIRCAATSDDVALLSSANGSCISAADLERLASVVEGIRARGAEVGFVVFDEESGTTRKFGNSIQWLADADLVHRCLNVSTPTFPLRAYEREDYFKLYVGDTGLLVAMFGYEMKRAVLDRTLKGPAKGGLYENLIAEFLVKAGHGLHYYKPDENDQEIEFLLDCNRQPIPVEVKARRGATRSLDGFIGEYSPEVAYKFADGNVGREGAKVALPHYMAMFL